MISLLRWALVTLILAALIHVGVIWGFPRLVMQVLHNGVVEQAGVNTALHAPKVTAESRSVVRPSPDLLYSICAFDVSEEAVYVRSPVPPTYWSVSAFASNTDNFFVMNDRQAGEGPVDLVIKREGTWVDEPPGAVVLVAESERGVILFRTLIQGEEQADALDAVRRQATCETISQRPQ